MGMAMAEAKEAQEPSMEEILASIRRIISDEDSPAEPAAAEEAPEEVDGSEELNQDALDALFDAPAPAEEPEEELSEEEAGVEMDQNDLDALFDTPAPAEDPEPEPEPEPAPEPEPEPELAEPVIVEGLDPDDSDISFAEEEEDEIEDDDPPLDLGPEFEVPDPDPVPEFDVVPDMPLESTEQVADALLSPTTDAVVSSAFGNLAHTILSKNARTLEDLVQEMLRPMLKSWLDDNLPVIVERLVRKEIERVTRNGGK